MDAVEYLRARARMCAAIKCQDCEHWNGEPESNCLDELCKNPARAVEIVRRWAQENPEEPQLALSAMEQRFVHIYIEKGFLWAARNKDGRLRLYKRCPERADREFTNTSASLESSRDVIAMVFPAITWENSPVCLPKLLERGTIS